MRTWRGEKKCSELQFFGVQRNSWHRDFETMLKISSSSPVISVLERQKKKAEGLQRIKIVASKNDEKMWPMRNV